jgi:hypothetical protein
MRSAQLNRPRGLRSAPIDQFAERPRDTRILPFGHSAFTLAPAASRKIAAMKTHRIQAGALGLAAALACAGTAYASTGPSSSDAPYVIRSKPGVVTKSILTVGDSVGGYRMAGIPDGLGAFDNGDGTFTLLANQEIGTTSSGVPLGVERAHGAAGAFVSKWTIDKKTLEVQAGSDLIQNIATWNGSSYNATAKGIALNRLCSADLPAYTAFFNPQTGKGFDGRLFLSGEESGNEGRPFAHGLGGTSWELGYLGNQSFENLVANPSTGDKTVVATTDDTTPGQVYVYVGDKRSEGATPVDRAGLSGGSLYGIKVDGFPSEPAGGIPSGTHFSLANLGDVSGKTGSAIDTDSNTAGVTRFLRPEDAAWDTQDPNVLYFVTTNGFNSPSRLWRARFDDISNPAAGGTIDELLDGTEGQQMLDNLTVSRRGDLILQEDPGNNPYVARIWRYSPSTDKLVEVAHHDANLFTSGGNAFITQDEESSGVIDASSLLGDGWFLFDDQVHKATTGDPELVERGQLLALHVPPGQKD